MSLVEHARRELSHCNKNDPDINESLIKCVEAFAEYGHSGGSASWAIPALNQLLQFKNLTPLTDNPDEWVDVSEYCGGNSTFQSIRRSDAFSKDGGKTYTCVNENDKTVHVSEPA